MSISRDYLVWFDPAICLEGALSKEWSSHCKTYIEIYSKRERKSSRLSACPPAPTWCAKSSDGSSVDTHLGERQMISFDLLKLGLMTRDPMILWSLRGMVCAVTRQGCSPRAFSQRVKLNLQSKAADYRGSGFLPGGSAGNRYMCHVVPV
jgi:hypothetical protein